MNADNRSNTLAETGLGEHLDQDSEVADGDAEQLSRMGKLIYYEALEFTVSDLRFLFCELDAVVQPDELLPDDDMVPWILEALATCRHDEGLAYAPCNRYEKWWAALPDPSVWPSANQIRRVFGGWLPPARLDAGRPQEDVKALRALRRGETFTREGLCATAAAWIASLPRDAVGEALGHPAFQAWAREQRAKGSDLELPKSFNPWIKHFEGWSQLLNEFGLWVARLSGPPGERPAACPVTPSEAALITELQLAALQCGGALTVPKFEDWVYGRILTAAKEGRVLELGAASSVRSRFGTWGAGLAAAGVRQAGPPGSQSRQYDEAAIFNAISACASERKLGKEAPSSYLFQRWRSERLGDCRKPLIVSQERISSRFDGWHAATEAWSRHCRARGSFKPSAAWLRQLEEGLA